MLAATGAFSPAFVGGYNLRPLRLPPAGVLCRIPLPRLALTPQTCVEDPDLGEFFGSLLAEGEIDRRLCLMLFLVVHKALGPRSAWAPYPHTTVTACKPGALALACGCACSPPIPSPSRMLVAP